ncbi:galectin-3b [Mastacembelus armatus]|uniref:Galectin n=1 Tax=Mastacembelus armatus TaxID=205130 RepID=A0A3Q3RTS5_9TELE|nr:galectin-3 [Mastacembelus armatus]
MMNLSDALDEWPGGNQSGANPTWPGGQPGANPAWPGGQPGANPAWPGGQPGANPAWPGGQPGANPAWPGGQPGANPTWPGGQPGANPTWPGGNPSQPSWPTPQPSAPGGWPSPTTGPGPAVPAAPQQSLAVPYKQILPNGLYDKLLITIAGTIKPSADKITVDLATANDLAFHFNPRFNESGKKVIVRNTCIGSTWGKEERELQAFPFVQGQPFEMKILCTKENLKVAVNNSHLLQYKHRITDLKSINKLNIYNDLVLSKVNIETVT